MVGVRFSHPLLGTVDFRRFFCGQKYKGSCIFREIMYNDYIVQDKDSEEVRSDKDSLNE